MGLFLTFHALTALTMLSEPDGVPIRDVASRAGLSYSATSRHLRGLARMGMADRERCGRRVLYRSRQLGLGYESARPQRTQRSTPRSRLLSRLLRRIGLGRRRSRSAVRGDA